MNQQQYEQAKRDITEYENDNFRKPYESLSVINHVDFNKIVSSKHHADLECGDIVWMQTRDTFGGKWDESIYQRVLCTGRCGRDEFWGKNMSDGKPRSWMMQDWYKIVGVDSEMKKQMSKQQLHDQIADNYKLQ